MQTNSYAGIVKVNYLREDDDEEKGKYEISTLEEELIIVDGFIDAVEIDETGNSFTVTVYEKS